MDNHNGSDISIEILLDQMSRPAASALQHVGIKTLQQLAQLTEKEILGLHGIGKASIPTINSVLEANSLKLKQ